MLASVRPVRREAKAAAEKYGPEWCAIFVPAFIKQKARSLNLLGKREGVDCPICLGVLAMGAKGDRVKMRRLQCGDKCAPPDPLS